MRKEYVCEAAKQVIVTRGFFLACSIDGLEVDTEEEEILPASSSFSNNDELCIVNRLWAPAYDIILAA